MTVGSPFHLSEISFPVCKTRLMNRLIERSIEVPGDQNNTLILA